MDEYSNRELFIKLEDGFTGVNDRLDRVNGNVSSHDKRINKIEGWKNKLIGAFILTNVVFLPIIFCVIALLIKKAQ